MSSACSSRFPAQQTIKRLETALGFVVAFNSRSKNEPVDSGLAAELIEAIAEDLGVDIYDENEIEFLDYPDGADLDTVEWTPEYLKTFLGVICEHGGSGLEAALAKRIAKWRVELAEAKARVKSLEIEADRKKRQRIVPNSLELEKIVVTKPTLSGRFTVLSMSYRDSKQIEKDKSSHLLVQHLLKPPPHNLLIQPFRFTCD